MGWIDRAACVGMDPEAFFPVNRRGRNAGPWEAAVAAAVEVCARCEVRGECASDAVLYGDTDGIRAGVNLSRIGPAHARRTLRKIVADAGLPVPMPVRKRVQHGSMAGFRSGCRCRWCEDAHTRYRFELRAQGRA